MNINFDPGQRNADYWYSTPKGTTSGHDYIHGPVKRKLDIMVAGPASVLALPAIVSRKGAK